MKRGGRLCPHRTIQVSASPRWKTSQGDPPLLLLGQSETWGLNLNLCQMVYGTRKHCESLVTPVVQCAMSLHLNGVTRGRGGTVTWTVALRVSDTTRSDNPWRHWKEWQCPVFYEDFDVHRSFVEPGGRMSDSRDNDLLKFVSVLMGDSLP